MTTIDAPSLDSECFFIAPIGKDGSPERKRSDAILKFVVARAAAELGLTAVRADQISEPGQITLQVIDHVLRSRAAVADLTGSNASVYYELAIRHTAKLPVALIAEKDCTLPFDIAQMRTIFVDHTDLASADSCREAIVVQLRGALSDRAAVDSPVATSIDVRALQGGDKVERNIAELVTAVEDLAMMQRQSLMRMDHFEILFREMVHSLESAGGRAFHDLAETHFNDLAETYAALRSAAENNEGNTELRIAPRRFEEIMERFYPTTRRRPDRDTLRRLRQERQGPITRKSTEENSKRLRNLHDST